jgi:hypothetical protein
LTSRTLHGFTQESTRTTLVSTRQDLVEEDGFQNQPYSARGLVGHSPWVPRKERRRSSPIILLGLLHRSRLGLLPPGLYKGGQISLDRQTLLREIDLTV